MDKFNLITPSLNIIIASQGSGKSHLIKYLMYKLRKNFDYGLVFSNTFFDDDPFPYIEDKTLIHPEYNEEVLENLMKIQAKVGKRKSAYVIFDDCIDDPEEFKSPVLKKLSTQLRHYNITIIFTTQYCNALPPRMRSNAMNIFMFHTDNKNSLEALYNSFGQAFESYNEFKKYIMDKTSVKYNFIYYNKMLNDNSLENNYKVYRCPAKIPSFKIKFNNKL